MNTSSHSLGNLIHVMERQNPIELSAYDKHTELEIWIKRIYLIACFRFIYPLVLFHML